MKNTPLQRLALAAALALSTSAGAQSAGSWLLRAGATNISPQVSSGDLSAPSLPGTQADVGDSTRLSGALVYMVSDHFAVDLPLALPFRHEIRGDGAIAGVGKLGDVKVTPVTVLAQYRFGAASAKFRPYVGAGPTYAKFYQERSTGTLTAITGGTPANPTTLSVESRLGLTLQLGTTFALDERWFADAAVTKTFLKTRTTLSTGQSLDTRLDPLSLCLGLGYRF